ncbi:MAG: GNAT family N-acetyltransferase [Gammaproteobacteria bacterium]
MSDIQVVPFTQNLKPWFAKLNRVWLERYFVVEPIDALVLDHPEEHVLANGGHIMFAVCGDEVFGTCALKCHDEGVYELTKMAVDDSVQGKGVGRLLLDAAIAKFKELEGARLFLESHDSLVAALRLYETGGFEHTPRPDGPSPYVRSNIYMVWQELSR